MSDEIYFFHGLESGPHGSKYRRLCESFEVTSPDFQGMEIWRRLEKAEQLTREMTDLVVVGSSYGGLLAALLYSAHPERFKGYVLLAPALYGEPAEKIERMPDNAVVIHGSLDDVVPLSAVQPVYDRFGVDVRVVEDGHRLSESHEAMVAAVNEVYSGDR